MRNEDGFYRLNKIEAKKAVILVAIS